MYKSELIHEFRGRFKHQLVEVLMKHQYQKPHHELTDYVRTVLVLEGFSEDNSVDLPLVTQGMPALFCKTERDADGIEKVERLALFGKTVSPDLWKINPGTTIITYFFKPFAIACIFNVPAAKIVDVPLDLSSWNAHKANALKTQLAYGDTTSRKTEVLDHLLISQLEENQKACEVIRIATDQMMLNSNTDVLSSLLKKLGLNERTFQRMFKKYVGVTPNHYRRICQFHASFTQVRSQEFETLSDVAYDNGFADQSHFIRSFKEFTETTPNQYIQSGLKEKN